MQAAGKEETWKEGILLKLVKQRANANPTFANALQAPKERLLDPLVLFASPKLTCVLLF